MAMIAGKVCSCLLEAIIKGIAEIADRVSLLKLNKDQENRIVRKIHTIKLLLEELTPLQHKLDLPESFTCALEDLNQQIERCKEYCQPEQFRSGFRSQPIQYGIDIMCIKDRHRYVQDLEKGLDGAINMLQAILTAEGIKCSDEMHSDLKERMQFQSNTGIYAIEDPHLQPPNPVEDFTVELDEKSERLVLSWRSDNNAPGIVEEYKIEVCNDHGHKTHTTTKYKQVAINDLEAGKRYTFKVRAIGKGGAGKWSPEKTMYFRTAVPTKPQKPLITVEGTKEILISFAQPSEQECNGANISHCIVEYIAVDGNSTEIQSLACPIKHKSSCENKMIKMRIKGLIEDTVYEVHVKFRNAAGDGPPSEKVTIRTNEPIPGPPVDFRLSSKRTAHTIKLRWSQPSINPRFACSYQLDMRRKRGEWGFVACSRKLSAEATALNQDTKYYFRVKAINRNGDCSSFAEEIEAETRFSSYSKAALAPLVFIGGTFAAPFVASIGLGIGSGIVASNVVSNPDILSNPLKSPQEIQNMITKDKTAGETAARVAAGVVGGVGGGIVGSTFAPLVGGFLTHQFVHWGDNYSDQSDDEEENDGLSSK